MSEKTVLSDDPVGVIEYLQGIGAEPGAREDEIRIDWRPGSCQPAEIDARIFHIEETIGRDDSRC